MSADGTAPDRCRFKDLCIDVTDPHRQASFWAAALGLEAEALDNGAYRLGDDVAEHTVWINPVPERRSVKQRIHWDVLGDTAGLLGSGASLLRSRRDVQVWDVLADPEGNVFCVFPPRGS